MRVILEGNMPLLTQGQVIGTVQVKLMVYYNSQVTRGNHVTCGGTFVIPQLYIFWFPNAMNFLLASEINTWSSTVIVIVINYG